MVKKPEPKPPRNDNETDVARLERLLRDEEARLAVEHDPNRRQTTSRTVVMICAELRKARKEERAGADELDEARILDWFLRQDPTKQGRFVRELTARMKKGSGLA